MPSKRVIQAGHVLAILFVALLLVGARGFLAAHPVLAAVLLAAFAPCYYFAARITGYRQFLYPSVLLAVLAYQLLLDGAGLPLAWQPFSLLIPVAVIYLAARAGVPRRVKDASLSLHGVNTLIITVFGLWILFRVPWFFDRAAVITAIALIGYAVFFWLRFRQSETAAHSLAAVILGSGGFLFLLYSHSQITLAVGALLGLLTLGDFYSRGVLRRTETFALTVVSAYLLFAAFTSAQATRLPLGYLVLAAMWLHLALELYRPEEVPILGPHAAPLPRLVPLFGAGIVLALVPIALFYPWKPVFVSLVYLAILFVVFWITGRELAKRAVTLIGVGLARALAALGRVAPFAALAYLAWHRFPNSYSSASVALFVGLVSLLAGWRQEPHMLLRRNIYVYQAGIFLTLAYFLAERRFTPQGIFASTMDSGALLLLGLIAAGYALRNILPRPYVQSLWDAAAVPVAVGCILQVMRNPGSLSQALLLGGVLLVAALLALIKVRQPAVLFTLPVVLGFWIYVIQWSLGIRGESLGLPYLLFGLISAGAGYALLRKQNRWYELFYFMWFLCTGVSLALFYPCHGIGAYAAPWWPVAYLLVSRAFESRRDFAFALVLEVASGLLAVYSVAILIFNGLYLPAAMALFLYSLLYAWIGVTRRFWFYFYPAAGCAVTAYFLATFVGAGARMFLPYFLPGAIALYFLAAWLRRSQYQRGAFPFELATSAGVLLGAFLFLTLPFGTAVTAGWLTGVAYLVLFLLLAKHTQERAFLGGWSGRCIRDLSIPACRPSSDPSQSSGHFHPCGFSLGAARTTAARSKRYPRQLEPLRRRHRSNIDREFLCFVADSGIAGGIAAGVAGGHGGLGGATDLDAAGNLHLLRHARACSAGLQLCAELGRRLRTAPGCIFPVRKHSAGAGFSCFRRTPAIAVPTTAAVRASSPLVRALRIRAAGGSSRAGDIWQLGSEHQLQSSFLRLLPRHGDVFRQLERLSARALRHQLCHLPL